jgi:hypothetical protein
MTEDSFAGGLNHAIDSKLEQGERSFALPALGPTYRKVYTLSALSWNNLRFSCSVI